VTNRIKEIVSYAVNTVLYSMIYLVIHGYTSAFGLAGLLFLAIITVAGLCLAVRYNNREALAAFKIVGVISLVTDVVYFVHGTLEKAGMVLVVAPMMLVAVIATTPYLNHQLGRIQSR
jgi:hypothetical protein